MGKNKVGKRMRLIFTQKQGLSRIPVLFTIFQLHNTILRSFVLPAHSITGVLSSTLISQIPCISSFDFAVIFMTPELSAFTKS